jgi:hypothetical protein
MMNPDVGLRSNPAAYPALDTEVRAMRPVVLRVADDVSIYQGVLHRCG